MCQHCSAPDQLMKTKQLLLCCSCRTDKSTMKRARGRSNGWCFCRRCVTLLCIPATIRFLGADFWAILGAKGGCGSDASKREKESQWNRKSKIKQMVALLCTWPGSLLASRCMLMVCRYCMCLSYRLYIILLWCNKSITGRV